MNWRQGRLEPGDRLSVQERDERLAALTGDQQSYLQSMLTRGRRTRFANSLARAKGYQIPEDTDPEDLEQMLDEWVYAGFVDGGQVTPELRCECGRALRYRHEVRHKTSGITRYFGIDHLMEHTGIDAKVVADILKGFEAIDYELDEILLKLEKGWSFDPSLLSSPMPPEIERQVQLELPLLDRQILFLRRQQVEQKKRDHKERPVEERMTNGPLVMDDLFGATFPGLPQPLASAASVSENEPSDSTPVPFDLPVTLQEPVLNYLRSGTKSVRIICELLIHHHGAPGGRFSTGKPKLFPTVCLFLEGRSEWTGSSIGQEDRSYTGKEKSDSFNHSLG
ncbi:DUF3895 domain-containing protein [Gorillibacterium sp. CAU 1737]|uniref:DUF3895 domain-containing protein n=1 Tax=Gorillibacterium sp. CAU 1737 TaxID=3140362 RepID=UPI00326173CF